MSVSSFPFFSVKRSLDMRMHAIRDRGQPALPRYSYPGRYMEKHLLSSAAQVTGNCAQETFSTRRFAMENPVISTSQCATLYSQRSCCGELNEQDLPQRLAWLQKTSCMPRQLKRAVVNFTPSSSSHSVCGPWAPCSLITLRKIASRATTYTGLPRHRALTNLMQQLSVVLWRYNVRLLRSQLDLSDDVSGWDLAG